MNRPVPEIRSKTMRAVKSVDTGPEMVVRRLLHRMGYRYRLHCPDLPGKPDIVFRSRKKVILVNGCFWHGHGCVRGNRLPKNNREYWSAKIASNVSRDTRHYAKLSESGWVTLVIWECEIRNIDNLRLRLEMFMEGNTII
jgi:DNA mismatch endonuclease (patch repair protein)